MKVQRRTVQELVLDARQRVDWVDELADQIAGCYVDRGCEPTLIEVTPEQMEDLEKRFEKYESYSSPTASPATLFGLPVKVRER